MRQGRKDGRATIYDIADDTGTSSSTVSLVLSGAWQRYRIKPATAERITAAAARLGYRPNLRARGLRLARSNLAGMIMPHHRNRFFAGLAEAFEEEARARGLCPIIVSTQRDPGIEASVLGALLQQRVESVFVVGVDRPDVLNEVCRGAGVASVNLDLPGAAAPSVVSDNRGGARRLTEALIGQVREAGGAPGRIAFVGGRPGEFATSERIAGFREALATRGFEAGEEQINICGYGPDAARAVFEGMAARQGRLPPGLFVNSITTFEGFADFLSAGNEASCRDTRLACFDWDPFAAALPVSVTMMRQNVEAMIAAAFALLEADPAPLPGTRVTIPPVLERRGGGTLREAAE